MKKILIHGSGHKATSWNKTMEYIENNNFVFCMVFFICSISC